jgi:hypothetical protein
MVDAGESLGVGQIGERQVRRHPAIRGFRPAGIACQSIDIGPYLSPEAHKRDDEITTRRIGAKLISAQRRKMDSQRRYARIFR